ncbi:PREDICTED: LOW QUALITY PROTEIN: probable ATP-dependent RNA helicase DDX28 [Priapulus caudatus]|uniref:RNA helicase n=1 Tax=Priapulus caudatus TaxID=37621 RepID=A0ABM1EQE7_PRICU|nr:PREDICTED: LOW QUALITY PROTEIN: probable ATP-dependent RNA helicase DDX28 [Priapulus caudatus]
MKNRSSSCHDHFTINSTQGNPSLTRVDDAEEASTFEHLGLKEELVTALTASGFKSPTSVQELLIPEILRGNNVLCGAETGSGRQWPYLAPVVQHIFDANSASATAPQTNSPQALVSCRAESWPNKSTLGRRARGVDDAVGAQQYSLVPLIPKSLHHDYWMASSAVESLMHVTGEYLHRVIAPRYAEDRPEALLVLLKSNTRRGIPTIVFCNNTKGSDFVNMLLEENGIPNVVMNGHMTEQVLPPPYDNRPIRVSESQLPRILLLCRSSKTSSCTTRSVHSFQDGRFLTLVCTDVGSRGLDTLKVRHVINFDFPLNMSDYIHRCGRTGRVGTLHGGHVTNFVCFKNNVELVQQIELSVRKSDSLPKVNANIRRRLFYRALARDGSPNAVHPADITAPPSEEEGDEAQAGRE